MTLLEQCGDVVEAFFAAAAAPGGGVYKVGVDRDVDGQPGTRSVK